MSHFQEVTMKLQTSKLCVNCESLYEGNITCPFCRSDVFVWLNRALGTTLEVNPEPVSYFPAEEEVPPSQRHFALTGAPTNSSGNANNGFKSFGEIRITLEKFGRDMARVLTLGVIQAFK